MPIDRCERHQISFDRDWHTECPLCESEPAETERAVDMAWQSLAAPTVTVMEKLRLAMAEE